MGAPVDTESPGVSALDRAPARAIGVARAGEVIRGLGPREFLHAGPPLVGAEPVGPMRGAMLGALVLEGEARDVAEAAEIVDAGEVALRCAHSSDAVGAMAGIISPRIPVVVVEGADGERVHAPLNEGLGVALRFGSTSDRVLDRLRWLGEVATPLLDAALCGIGGVDVIALQAEGLRRGDECHNRNVASTAALALMLAPAIAAHAPSPGVAAELLTFIAGNPHFFLSFSMAAGKAVGDAAHRAGHDGLVTAICANGHEVGIRVSGTDGWFTAPAPRGRPRLLDGFTADDACPMLGDSFMTETIGLGAFALVAAPAISSFIGADAAEADALMSAMRRLCLTSSSRFLIPAQDYAGTPLGIDVHRVAETGISPIVNNGFAHREPGIGQVGAGITELPTRPFHDAVRALKSAA
jgi:hypothetical protein